MYSNPEVMSYQPKMMEKAIEFANDQMDQKVLTIAKRQVEQKRKLEFNTGGNHQGAQQQNQSRTLGGLYTDAGLGHFKIDCPKLNNKNHGNQGGNGNAPAKVWYGLVAKLPCWSIDYAVSFIRILGEYESLIVNGDGRDWKDKSEEERRALEDRTNRFEIFTDARAPYSIGSFRKERVVGALQEYTTWDF
ncbi:hypothetical protein Tco_0308737 [Tanacetum coccineum]